jgi:hypothetical protein
VTSVQLWVILRMLVIPAVAASAAVVVARAVAPAARPWVLALGAAVGVIATNLGLAGVPRLPPIDTIGWIPIAVGGGFVVLAAFEWPAARRPGLGLGALAIVAAFAAWAIGRPTWAQIGAGRSLGWIGGGALAVVAVAGGAASAATRIPPLAVGLALVATTAGGALAAAASHSALLAMVLGGVAATIGALSIGGRVLGRPIGDGATFGVLALGMAGPILYGALYASLPLAVAALLVASGLAPLVVARLPTFRGRAVLAPVLALALAGAAAGLAKQTGDAAESGVDAMYGAR